MAEISGGEKLAARLAELSQNVRKAASLKVGFMNGATYPDGQLVSAVAAFNEFGVASRNQPPRPFFRRMIAENSPQWPEKIAKLLEFYDYDASKVLDDMGDEISADLRQSIIDFTSPGLAPSTIAAKGFDKPLIETSLMLNSITNEVAK